MPSENSNYEYLCGVSAIVGADIDKASQLLREGKLVAIPTETVYGLAANALDEKAVLAIFKAKQRPDFDPLIVHAKDKDAAFSWASYVPETAKKLAEAFWPGPLTLVLPKETDIPYVVTSGLDTVGLRVPNHPLTQRLLATLPFPLAAPSANPFGYISPTTAQHVQENLGEQIGYILDGGACTHGLESTIIGFENDQPIIYRRGSLSKAEIENVIGPIAEKIHSSSNPKAPGQLAVHYAPKKKLILVDPSQTNFTKEPFTLINFGQELDALAHHAQTVLSFSETGDATEAARKFYGVLREADHAPNPLIITAYIPHGSLADAINDRLKRAATQQ